MSATATTTQSLSILADYEVHHSSVEQHHATVNLAPSSTQPADWPSHHRRMPAYRPANRNLDLIERPAGSNGAEYVFIQVMLHGVWLNASAARFWRFTGGRISDKLFHYEVGGEW
ncbi:hypothetical protein N7510_006712 [Penicillium lagena]|uniref:uncharacterized protein n=1 Tax=Penicillium lagena TaxID=94218 RepID=UPI0025400D21|nr:uncharacterized protein N7510_006712 [Penicillium lagena]KAJ5609993.1 hypothetical protein N7510_006712 [Penicillium lagena]